jgi:hypothetical protein
VDDSIAMQVFKAHYEKWLAAGEGEDCGRAGPVRFSGEGEEGGR